MTIHGLCEGRALHLGVQEVVAIYILVGFQGRKTGADVELHKTSHPFCCIHAPSRQTV